MDLSTTYLGMKLPHPLMPGASPMVEDLDTVRRLEDSGTPVVILHSLFEEQILAEELREVQDVEIPEESFAEALTYYPNRREYPVTGPDQYLERIRKIKETVSVPVIASLNGVSANVWAEYAGRCEEAGADGLELNAYFLSTDPEQRGEVLEDRVIEAARVVKAAVKIPVAVKVSPFFSSLPNFARRLEAVGADGLVIFNRFYQPDIDVEELEVVPRLRLSDSSELLLRLRWLAILSGRVGLCLGVTGGVQTAVDAVKAVMAGADGVQMVSALLENGPEYLGKVRDEMASWMEKHGYESVEQMRGSMNLLRSPDPASFERANYTRVLLGGTSKV